MHQNKQPKRRAGRPAVFGVRLVPITLRLPPAVLEFLEAQGNAQEVARALLIAQASRAKPAPKRSRKGRT